MSYSIGEVHLTENFGSFVVFKTPCLVFLEGFLEPHVVNQVLAYAICMFCCDS